MAKRLTSLNIMKRLRPKYKNAANLS